MLEFTLTFVYCCSSYLLLLLLLAELIYCSILVCCFCYYFVGFVLVFVFIKQKAKIRLDFREL